MVRGYHVNVAKEVSQRLSRKWEGNYVAVEGDFQRFGFGRVRGPNCIGGRVVGRRKKIENKMFGKTAVCYFIIKMKEIRNQESGIRIEGPFREKFCPVL